MKKEMAAPQSGTTQTNCLATGRADSISHLPGPATKIELVACHLLENGLEGISALSALAGLKDLNLRNSISKLRRHHGITIEDKLFDHQHSGGGLTHLKRYWLANRGEARKVAELVNLKRKQRRAAPISREQIALYAGLFTAEPKAEANTNDRLAAILSTYAIDKYDVEIMPVEDIGQKG